MGRGSFRSGFATVFSNMERELVESGRVGNKVHPCTVLPKYRILAVFSLVLSRFHIRKYGVACRRNENYPFPRKSALGCDMGRQGGRRSMSDWYKENWSD